MNMHSKYDNLHKNGMTYALKFINNHVISTLNYMLSHNGKSYFVTPSSFIASHSHTNYLSHLLVHMHVRGGRNFSPPLSSPLFLFSLFLSRAMKMNSVA